MTSTFIDGTYDDDLEANWDESSRPYQDALALLQAHHDRTSVISDERLADAFREYVIRWQHRIRRLSYRYGFSEDDTSTVAQEASFEFFVRKVRTGVFDPSRGEFAIFARLIVQRAIDRQRHINTAKELINKAGTAADPFVGAPPSPPAEDAALGVASIEAANAELCREAALDERETLIITCRYVDGIKDWDSILVVVNQASPPPPIGSGRLRNLHTQAKKKIRDHLERRARRSDEEGRT